MNRYTQQDRPIYGWVMKDDGSIVKLEPITEYLISTYGLGGVRYRFRVGTAPKTIEHSQMDVFFHNRLYSFENNDKKALRIIRETLETKVRLLEIDLTKAKNKLDMFNEQRKDRTDTEDVSTS